MHPLVRSNDGRLGVEGLAGKRSFRFKGETPQYRQALVF